MRNLEEKNVRTFQRKPDNIFCSVPILNKICLGFTVKTTLMHTPGSKNITEQKNAVIKQEFVNREA